MRAQGLTHVTVDAPCTPTGSTLVYGKGIDEVETALSRWLDEASEQGLEVSVWLRGALSCRWTAQSHLLPEMAARVAHYMRCGASMVVLEEAVPTLTPRRVETVVQTIAAHGLPPHCPGFAPAANEEVTENNMERALQHQGLDFMVSSFGSEEKLRKFR